ncbi:MAG TPA: CopG family transcriptional regulator, partial [Acidimicrobiia bacterium]
MSSEEFDKLVDDNEHDIIEHLDLDSARRPGRDVRRVNVDLPTWMIDSLDVEAARVGVTRQSIIKMWLADRLDR